MVTICQPPAKAPARGAPKRAAGRWELEHVGGGGTVIGTQYLCVGPDSDEKESVFDGIAMNVNCSKYDSAPADGGWKFEFVCGGAMTSTTRGAITGDFVKAYKIEMTESDGTTKMGRRIAATNTGACPAGTRPGTLSDERGRVVAGP